MKHSLKRSLAAMLLLTAAILFAVPGKAYAAGDSISSATSYTLGATKSGSITDTNTADYYSFTLNSSGRITLTASAAMENITYVLYDSSGTELWTVSKGWDSTTEISNVSETIDLTKGDYYFLVKQRQYFAATGTYTFSLSFASTGESFAESQGGANNSLAAANSISTGKTYTGQIALNDVQDYYKVTLSSSGRITLTASAAMSNITYVLYDSSGTELWTVSKGWDSTTEISNVSETIDVTSGTYYFLVKQRQYFATTGNYEFELAFSSAKESFTEVQGGSNNSLAAASSISTDTTYKGQIALNDTSDYYKFTVKNSQAKITLKATAKMSNITYVLYDSSGTTQIWTKSASWDSSTGKSTISETIDLTKGTYYLIVKQRQYFATTGNYSIKLQKTGLAEEVGTTLTYKNNKYKVTSSSDTTGAVAFTKPSSSATSVTIPATITVYDVTYKVTSIASKAFKGNTKVTTVSIGSKVKKIGASAFYGCTKLTTVKGAAAVTSVGSKAFYKCKKLTRVGSTANTVTLSKVVTIGSSAFYGCSSIKKVNLTSTALTTLGANSFYKCTKLASFISKSKKLKSIGSKAFYGDSKLTSVTLSTSKLTTSNVKSKAFTGINKKCVFKVPSAKVSSYKKIFTARGAKSTITVKKKS